MKKKLKYLGMFVGILVIVFSFVSIKKSSFLFSADDSLIWNLCRISLFSIMISILGTGVLFFIQERTALKPYFAKLYQYRSLLYQLVRRDFKAKYKRSVLGVLWSVLNPLLTMLVMTVVFSTIFRFDIENFPVYLLSGQVIFTLFSESTNMCMGSVLGAASLMKKVSVPKYIFPLSKALSSLVNFAFSLLALLLVMLITHAPFHVSMLAMIIPIFYAFLFSLGVGMLLSAALVFFRDINYLYGILLTAVSYLTPLFYPISIIPDHFRWMVSLNPLYHFVECFRTVAIYGGLPNIWQNIICIVLALMALGMGLYVFYKKQDQFILYI